MSIVGPDSVRVGETAQYSAPLISPSGDTVRNVSPRWSTNGPSRAATIDADGVLRPLTWGWMSVDATYGDLGLARLVTIKPPEGSRLILSPHTAQVPSPGRWPTPFTAQIVDGDGVPISPQPDPMLHPLDPLIATWRIIEYPGYTCAKTDTIVAPNPGTARFSATFDDLADTATLIINTDPNPDVVTITPHTLYENMRYGSSEMRFTAEARDPKTQAILKGCCSWEALDPAVAQLKEVDSRRYVVPIHEGAARFRAWYLSGADTSIPIVDRSLPSLGFRHVNQVAEGDSIVGGVAVVDGYQIEHSLAEAGVLTIRGSNTSILEIRPNGTIGGLSPGHTSLYLQASALRPGLDSAAWEFEVDSLAKVVEVSGSAASGCALDLSSGPACWVSLTSPPITALRQATFEPALHSLTTVPSSTGSHACALSPAGEVYCWTWAWQDTRAPAMAATTAGQTMCWGDWLGDQASRPPTVLSTNLSFSALAASGHDTCGLTSEGRAYCWGKNDQGQLGGSTTLSFSPTPVEVSGDFRFSAISAGCGITTARVAICWGDGMSQLPKPITFHPY